MYLLPVADGNGPLKSIFNRSNGCVAFIKVPLDLWYWGFNFKQVGHDAVSFRMSSIEQGIFFVRA